MILMHLTTFSIPIAYQRVLKTKKIITVNLKLLVCLHNNSLKKKTMIATIKTQIEDRLKAP